MAKRDGEVAQRSRAARVVVMAPKGGVGKTTLAMSLLVSARYAGLNAIGVGMDPQRTFDKWAARRERRYSEAKWAGLARLSVEYLNVQDFRRISDYDDRDLVVVDTPPGHSEAVVALESLAHLADLVIVPTSSSAVDLDEVVPFSKRIGAESSLFVLNRVNRRSTSYQAARTFLVVAGRLAPVDVPMLEGIPRGHLLGVTVVDIRDSGWDNLDALWSFVAREVGLLPAAKVGEAV